MSSHWSSTVEKAVLRDRAVTVRVCFRDAMWPALKTEEGATSHRMWMASRSWKRKKSLP